MTIKTEIPRDMFMTPEKLAEHVRCVGQAIIDDAQSVATQCTHVRFIDITATVSPGTEITTVRYEIERYADPRITKRKEDVNNEQE